MPGTRSRRQFIAQVTAGVALAGVRPRAAAPAPQGNAAGMRLILLGTAGGPTPKATRAAPAQAIVFDGKTYVVDCGNGVARQLCLAGIPLATLRSVFLTHHHSDHNADYGTLLLLAWATSLKTPVDTWGPPPLANITRLFLEMSEPDISVRMADEGLPPLAPLVRPHEITSDGIVVRDGGLTVTCAHVPHPLVKAALAFRFDAPGRSIVVSGDTAPSPAVVQLARDADVLVHEVMYRPAMEKLAASSPDPAALLRHLANSHTSLEEVGRIATEANVKTLVLSHFVPGETTDVADAAWLQGARAHFKGQVVVGRDLLEV